MIMRSCAGKRPCKLKEEAESPRGKQGVGGGNGAEDVVTTSLLDRQGFSFQENPGHVNNGHGHQWRWQPTSPCRQVLSGLFTFSFQIEPLLLIVLWQVL